MTVVRPSFVNLPSLLLDTVEHPSHTSIAFSPAWDPKREGLLACGSASNGVKIWNAAAMQQPLVTLARSFVPVATAFHPYHNRCAVFLYVVYAIIYALTRPRNSNVTRGPQVQTSQSAPTFTLAFFDSLERGKDHAAQALKPPAPAYAYAAAGAIRRLSQTMWQGVRRPGTPVR